MKLRPSLSSLALKVLINFIAAAIGMLLFRHNDAHNFGTLPAAFVSIWMIETLDNWEDLMWINILGCHVYAAADDARALGGGLGDDAEAPSSFGLLRYGYDEGRLARPCTRSGAQGFGWIAAAYFVFMVVCSAGSWGPSGMKLRPLPLSLSLRSA